MTKSNKLVFFGSGPVGLATLKSLAPNFDIEAVITKPKPHHHRGDMPVLDFAASEKLKVYTPNSSDELTQLFNDVGFTSEIGVVVDYGLIIPKSVIASFRKGIINSHFSLLPQWRGADPITFSVLSGQEKTGVSLMIIDEDLDTGPILVQKSLPISKDDTTPTLTAKLIELSNQLLAEYLPKYLAGEAKARSQPHPDRASYSRKLSKADGELDLSKSASELEREVRAYADWPRSRVDIFGHSVIVTKARVAQSADDGDLVVEAKPGYLEIEQLTAPSGKTMSGAEFLRGYNKS